MRHLIAANWKMHGDLSWADKPDEFEALLSKTDRADIDILICPPFPLLTALKNDHKIHIGAQNCHAAVKGAHTGEVSVGLLKSAGASYVIVGHSERRSDGESDADVKAKAEAVLAGGLTPIICVGESLDVRESGKAVSHVEAQLEASLPEDTSNIVIAYEPIWAIGTGKVASIDDIEQMHGFIRKMVGPYIQLLYGGSVKPGNAKAILGTDNVNGALIGGASLEMDSLSQIARAAL